MQKMRMLALVLVACTACAAHAGREIETQGAFPIGADHMVTLAGRDKACFANIVFPDAALADAWLAKHVLQQETDFRTLGEDRYGRTLIAAADAQEEMLRAGVGGAVSAGMQPGSKVHVRGTIYPENGPMIRVTRVEQLEMMGAGANHQLRIVTPSNDRVPLSRAQLDFYIESGMPS